MPRRRRKNPQQTQRWLPSTDDHYYLSLGNGIIALFPWSDTPFDHETWDFGNCFKTHAQAIQARDKLQEVLLTLHQDHASPRMAKPLIRVSGCCGARHGRQR